MRKTTPHIASAPESSSNGSLIERILPKSIHAVIAKGFELKVALFVLASSINFLW